MRNRSVFVIILLFVASIATLLFSLHSGVVDLSWAEIFNYLCGKKITGQAALLLGSLRLPRTAAAFFIGASLGTSGLVFQTLLQNPLAEPYTLGLSGGSALGAILALAFSLEPTSFWVPALSTVGCVSAALIVLSFGQKRINLESRTLILFGVMISLFLGAVVVTVISILSPTKIQTALFWLMGEFGTTRDPWIILIGPLTFLCFVFLLLKCPALDALNLGETRALSLGFSPKREKNILFLICTLVTALGVSISGLVGFVGLVSPHIARKLLKSSSHRDLMVASYLTGAVILTIADSLGRSLTTNTEIPAGSIAALIGTPTLIFLILGRKQNASAE